MAALPRWHADEAARREARASWTRPTALTPRGNSEIAFSWLRIAIRNDYAARLCRSSRATSRTIGRRKLIKPLYEDLMKTPAGAARARAIYARGPA